MGYLVSVLGVVCMVVFSISLFLSDNLCMFWLFLELGTLSLVPCFFLHAGNRVLEGLFNYLIISSVASSLVVSGVLFEEVSVLLFLGLMIKFGLFPFFGWIYGVMLCSNWLVIWGFSTLLKVPFLFLGYFFSCSWTSLVSWSGSVSLLLFGGLFWVYTFSWMHCWCHMMLSSSVVIVSMVVLASSDVLLWIFLVYLIWASLVIWFFSNFGVYEGWLGWFFFVTLLISFPGSLSIFYKVLMCMGVYSCCFSLLICWVVYSLCEQVYLFSYLVGGVVPRGEFAGSVLC